MYQQELGRIGGDEELASRLAEAKFDRIAEAAIAGERGTARLASVAAVNMALDSSVPTVS